MADVEGAGSSLSKSPTRAESHAAKKKAVEARRGTSPGPGSYSPQLSSSRFNSKSAGRAATATFASKSGRGDRSKSDQTGDPGMYDPFTRAELASTSKKSVGKSNLAGRGSFGSRTARSLKIELHGEDTPAPGHYGFGKKLPTGERRTPSSAFASKSKQRPRTRNESTPGVGSYSPDYRAGSPEPNNPAMQMRGKGRRFPKELANGNPGPGAYENDRLRSGARSKISGLVGETDYRVAFLTDAVRELPWEAKAVP